MRFCIEWVEVVESSEIFFVYNRTCVTILSSLYHISSFAISFFCENLEVGIYEGQVLKFREAGRDLLGLSMLELELKSLNTEAEG